MKKTLKLIKNENVYILKSGEENLITISDKKINGSDIYGKIYFNLALNEQPEITIVPEGFDMEGTKIKEKEDRLVFDQVKLLFEKIDKAIKDSITKVII
jgi:nitrogen fixation protein